MLFGSRHTPHSDLILQTVHFPIIPLFQHALDVHKRLIENLDYFLTTLEHLLLYVAVIANLLDYVVIKSDPAVNHLRVEVRNVMVSVISNKASKWIT